MKIAILVPTRDREKLLLNLLASLETQIQAIPHHLFALFVLNTSESELTDIGQGLSLPLNYYHEPSKGYVIPRNQLLSKLDDTFDVGIFIDDDEYPSDCWLSQMIGSISKGSWLAVSGPVLPDFGGYEGFLKNVPLFYHDLNPKSRKKNLLGGNLALNLKQIFPVMGKELFDLKFNNFGGEDTYLAQQICDFFGPTAIGYNPSAIAFEVILPHRLTQDWLLFRAQTSGAAIARLRMELRIEIRYLLHAITIVKSFIKIISLLTKISLLDKALLQLQMKIEIRKLKSYLIETLK